MAAWPGVKYANTMVIVFIPWSFTQKGTKS